MSTAERREAALTRFRTELGREPTEDELSLLHETGVLPKPKDFPSLWTGEPLDYLGLIIKVVKEAERRGASLTDAEMADLERLAGKKGPLGTMLSRLVKRALRRRRP